MDDASKSKISRKDFGFVNLVVTKSDNEVKVWACSNEGICRFRLKASGKTYGELDATGVVVMSEL